MTLNITSSLTGGIRRIANRNGLLFAVAYGVLGLAWFLSFNSLFARWLAGTELSETAAELVTIDVPTGMLAAVGALALVGLTYLYVVAIRTFVAGHTSSVPSEYYTRNALFVLANAVVGGVAYMVVVTLGSILVVPGIVAYVAFLFVPLYVAVEDENFVAAFRNSWRLTRGNWLRLFGLVVLMSLGITAVSVALTIVVTIGAVAAGNEQLARVIAAVLYLPMGIVTLGILAEAFDQLRTDAAPGDGTAEL